MFAGRAATALEAGVGLLLACAAMLRADLHNHFDADPIDGRFIRYSIGELIDRAAALGIQVLAVTCHESIPYDDSAARYAKDKGVILLPGMEATVNQQHVLLLNFREYPAGICSAEDIAACKDAEALVIAPHPFYPAGMSGTDAIRTHPHIFDAVEFSGMYTPLSVRFNRQAQSLAHSLGLPVVGNTDTHFLWQLGYTFSWIDAPPEKSAVIEAIRQGRVRLETRPLRWHDIVRFIYESESVQEVSRSSVRYLRRVLQRTRRLPPSVPVPTPDKP